MCSAAPDLGSWRVYSPQVLPKPLAAALDAFFEHGYHGTTIRDIALRAGLSVPGVYHHYPSKQTLLVALIDAVMDELLARSGQAVAEAGAAPGAQFDALVENLVRFHMFRRKQAFVAATEIRSLEGAAKPAYVRRRDEQEQMFVSAIERIHRCGQGSGPPAHDCARAVLTMCVGVATWYRPDGPLPPEALVEQYLRFAHGVVGHVPDSEASALRRA